VTDDTGPPQVIHLAGTAITLARGHHRQRCAWCGYLLIDDDLTQLQVAICGIALESDAGEQIECGRPRDHPDEHLSEDDARQYGDFDPPAWATGAFVAVTENAGGILFAAIEPEDDERAPEGACLLLPPEMTRNSFAAHGGD
jgi:hypothetical protein